jgi:hypothetical protein
MAYLEFDIEVYTWVTSEADPDDKSGIVTAQMET